MEEKWYLSYDIKGIQQFIYTVPKLKYVVGASLLIAEYDDRAKTYPIKGCKPIFAGGGKGTFECDNKDATERLRNFLVEEAHKNGLDLRIGIAKELSEATKHADDLYPFVPESLEGEPCAVSGLWPIDAQNAKTRDGISGIHPRIAMRADAVRKGKERKLDAKILDKIRGNLPESLVTFEKEYQKPLEFLTVVGIEPEMKKNSEDRELETAQAANQALGGRNRWAILSMDGNDMGAQFRAFESTNPTAEYKTKWMRKMSEALRNCTQTAFYEGMKQAITHWWEDVRKDEKQYNNLVNLYQEAGKVVLPFRPLILGGDDILCICHCSYAMEMAETIIKTFTEKSQKEQAAKVKEDGIKQLWPGTGGRLTISAGIAYTGVTLPLFLSIPYAEHLLASAKSKFRNKDTKKEINAEIKVQNEPTPSAIDWESITETMVDTPVKRRERDLTFIDVDMKKENDENDKGKKITLTMRPYRIESAQQGKSRPVILQDIQDLKNKLKTYPRSILTELMTILRLPQSERRVRLTAIAARETNRLDFIDWLDEGVLLGPDKEGCCWRDEEKEKKNYFLDAVLLLEEEMRMEKETI